MALDLNCDLGEGEPISQTRALMRWISSANIACGGHAGDSKSMRVCVRLARQFKVNVGAHPGPWSRGDMGRGAFEISPTGLELLLLHQVSALEKISADEGAPLHHVKLHGALYHAVEQDVRLARRYAMVVKRHWPGLVVFGLARGGHVLGEMKRVGLEGWPEAFADRAYENTGKLVPRTQPGSVLSEVTEILDRLKSLTEGRGIPTADGSRLTLAARTVCLHSDSPNVLAVLRRAGRQLLRNA
jgi:UPF0271 protein